MKLLFKFVDVFVIAASLLPKSMSLSSFGFCGISDAFDGVLEGEETCTIRITIGKHVVGKYL